LSQEPQVVYSLIFDFSIKWSFSDSQGVELSFAALFRALVWEGNGSQGSMHPVKKFSSGKFEMVTTR